MAAKECWVKFTLRSSTGMSVDTDTLIEAMRYAGFVKYRKPTAGTWIIWYRASNPAAAQLQVLRLPSFGLKGEVVDHDPEFDREVSA